MLHAAAHATQVATSVWPREPGVALPLLLVSAGYAVGVARVWHLAGPGRGIERAAVLRGAIALLTLTIALLTPLATRAEREFSVHMVQHLLLMQVAAPLLVSASLPLALLWALPRAFRRTISTAPITRTLWRVTREWSRSIPLALAVHTVAVLAWHLPVAFTAAVHHEIAHASQHASFLGSALLFWYAVDTPAPALPAALAIFASGIVSALLGAILTMSDSLLYPALAARSAAWGIDPRLDQQLAGVIMWLPGGLVYLVVALRRLAPLLLDTPVTHTSGAR